MPEHFTRYGAFIFVLAQAASAVTAVLSQLIFWGFFQLPDLGWVVGNERTSALLPTALAAIAVGVLDTQGVAARPHGHGTGKWLFIDITFSLLKGLPLITAVVLLGKGQLTGELLDLAIVLAFLVAMDGWNWFASFNLEALPVTNTPAQPQPIITSFTTTPNTVAVGGRVRLNWTTTFAAEVEISGIGVVPLHGPLDVNPAGAAGTVVTYTLTARGAGGTVTQNVTVTLT